jgi:squalene-associated FAD-dependent desaturase
MSSVSSRGAAQVAIIGAGYAGMAAATELAACGIPVMVFEASRVLGGRARAVDIQGHTVDNGQHILIGAYRETLRLMRLVGAPPDRLLLRLPLLLDYPGELRIAAPRLPAPLHLACALLGTRGLNWPEKFAAIRFMQALQRANFRLAEDISVAALLDAHHQPQRLRDFLWEPLCVAALNTQAQQASAQVFLNVLRDSLAAAAQDSDLLLPRVDLAALFPEPAAQFVAAHGGSILRETAIQRISQDGKSYTLHGKEEQFGPFSAVIAAVAPYHLAPLIDGLPQLVGLRASIAGLQYEPIVTCYLGYPAQVRLPEPMIGHANGIAQWLFDRGQICGIQGETPGLLAAVISARGRHLELPNAELAARIHAEIAGIVPNLPPPLWSQVITEKRATFSCMPRLVRPPNVTALPGLLLAGDYVASDYPGTLEAALRSGVAAALAIAQD